MQISAYRRPPCPQTPIRKSNQYRCLLKKSASPGSCGIQTHVVQGSAACGGSETKCGSLCCTLSTSCLLGGSLLAVQVHPSQNLCLYQHGCPVHVFRFCPFLYVCLSRAVVLDQGSFALRGRLALPGDICGCHTWGWHPVGRGRGAATHAPLHRTAPNTVPRSRALV